MDPTDPKYIAARALLGLLPRSVQEDLQSAPQLRGFEDRDPIERSTGEIHRRAAVKHDPWARAMSMAIDLAWYALLATDYESTELPAEVRRIVDRTWEAHRPAKGKEHARLIVGGLTSMLRNGHFKAPLRRTGASDTAATALLRAWTYHRRGKPEGVPKDVLSLAEALFMWFESRGYETGPRKLTVRMLEELVAELAPAPVKTQAKKRRKRNAAP